MATTASLCDALEITTEELQSRLAFLAFAEEDRLNLIEIGRIIRAHVDEMIAEFYDHLNRFPELQAILSEPGLMERLKAKQRDYLLTLGQAVDARAYAEGRLRIGFVHERVGLQQKWYVGAYSTLFRAIARRLAAEYAGDAARVLSLLLTVEKVLRFDQIFVVDTYYHSTTRRLAESLDELQRTHQQLIDLSRVDPLTQVNNRRSLMELLEFELHRSRRFRHPFCVLFLDADHFKAVNDRYGHAFGDKVLQHITQIVRELTRPPDIVGRYGGEEFAVGLVECDEPGARQIAERIRAAIASRPTATDTEAVTVTVSIGLAVLMPDVDRVETLLGRADRALYQAKANGRNRIEVFRPGDPAGQGME